MIKHFVLNLNPHAQFEWERCALLHPITAEQPDLARLLAANIAHQTAGIPKSGSYLIAVNIEVTVLETTALETTALETTASAIASPIAAPTALITHSVAPRLARSIDRTLTKVA